MSRRTRREALRAHRYEQDEPIMVSIVVAAYNHARYIGEAIESFLMQETDFRVEILVNDDASTDDTAAAVREYEQRHPDLFVTFYQTENQYSQGKKPWFHVLFPAARGKYIALCEGDDYWTDPLKLQKQVDFLEADGDYVLAGHSSAIMRNGELNKNDPFSGLTEVTMTDLIRYNPFYTASIVFRSSILPLPNWFLRSPFGDYALYFHAASKGKLHRSADCMSVYREHEGGIHAPLHKSPTGLIKVWKKHLFFYQLVLDNAGLEQAQSALVENRMDECRMSMWSLARDNDVWISQLELLPMRVMLECTKIMNRLASSDKLLSR